LQEALRDGRFQSMEEALDRAIQSIAPPAEAPPTKRPPGKKSLVEICAMVRGLDLKIERSKDTGRPVDL